MPYMLSGKCVHKQNADGSMGDVVPGGCHDSEEEAKNHMRALYANVKNSDVVEMSMRISKASYNKSEKQAMKWEAIDSDTDSDLYAERMSSELYKDFVSRIENNISVPEPFKSIVCEDAWCGGMPYLSIAHYKSGSASRNVPGVVRSVFIDGVRLKSKGTLEDSPLGRKVWDSLREDLYMEKSGNSDHQPVRISIGFLDLEHKHVAQVGGQDFTFTRTDVGQICPLCSQGIGGKIYMKGQLIHLALTRVPVNPRTQVVAEKSMDIQTKKDDAKSIVGELADELEEKSITSDVLIVRSDGTEPKDDPSELSKCYDPNTDSFNQSCIDGVMNKYMANIRSEIGTTVKSVLADVIEEARRKDVSEADKKHAEKEYGDVKFADEANSKYPIDTKEHAKAALSYWGMPKNREKYSPEEQKKIGGRIRAAAKKFGIEVTDKKSDVVEDTMDEKSVVGIPEKPFSFTQDGVTISGDGNNTVANPVKAKPADDEEDKMDKGDDEAAEGEKPVKKSALDASYETLKSALASAKSVEDVQKAFNALGTEVEKAFAPEQKPVDVNDLAAIVKSAVEQAVAPLKTEIAMLKAGQVSAPASSGNVVKSKALNINHFTNPDQMIQKAIAPANQPVRKLSQIEQIARKSTGLQS